MRRQTYCQLDYGDAANPYRVTEEIDGNGHVTRFEYDGNGQRTRHIVAFAGAIDFYWPRSRRWRVRPGIFSRCRFLTERRRLRFRCREARCRLHKWGRERDVPYLSVREGARCSAGLLPQAWGSSRSWLSRLSRPVSIHGESSSYILEQAVAVSASACHTSIESPPRFKGRVWSALLGPSILVSFLHLGCVDQEPVTRIPGRGPVAEISQYGHRIHVTGAEGTALRELISLDGFGDIKPSFLSTENWSLLGELPAPDLYYDGLLWDLGGQPAAVQVIRRVNQENGKPYYLLRLKLYTLTPLDYVQPSVRTQLPDGRFSDIGFDGSDGGRASLVRRSDGIFIYWYE